jgi:GMP synthase-like glutamine amidotransferase
MQAHVFQHVPFEGLGSIESWLESHRYSVSTTRLFAGDSLPDMEKVDFLIVLGGPMSVNDEKAYPWLVEEKRFVRNMIETKKPVLGICLGAQIIAGALGAAVFPNSEKEIGWFPIMPVKEQNGRPDLFQFSQFSKEALVFHWHGETFNLPKGAVHIARSAACAHQAFQVGSSVLGLQFHLEMTAESAARLAAECKDELVPAKFIQTENEILKTPPERYRAANILMEDVLTFLTRKV